MSELPRTSTFYQHISFPLIGHRMISLVDETYAMSLSGALVEGREISDPGPLRISIYKNGAPMDINYSVLGVPIVSARAADVLRSVAAEEVQLFPATWSDPNSPPQAGDPHFVVNIRSLVDCAIPDGPHDFVIDAMKAAGHNLFRPTARSLTIIVSDSLRRSLVDSGLVIAGFIPCRLR